MSANHYGWLVQYDNEERFLEAVRAAHRRWGRRVRAYAPYPVEGLDEALQYRPSPIPAIMFCAGLTGAVGAFYLQWYAVHDWPLNVGGRPIASWPSFIPITFELTVLTAALTGLCSLLILARLPRLDHPTFGAQSFQRASQDRFFVSVVDESAPLDRAQVLGGLPQALSLEELFR